MSNTRNTSSSWTKNDAHAHYKVTRTVTGTDGKTYTETVEMVDDDALQVSLFNRKPYFLFVYFKKAYARYAFTS